MNYALKTTPIEAAQRVSQISEGWNEAPAMFEKVMLFL